MHDVTMTREPVQIAWTGLVDVEGTCDTCAKFKPLTVEYVPTSAWMCRACFRDYWRDEGCPS